MKLEDLSCLSIDSGSPGAENALRDTNQLHRMIAKSSAFFPLMCASVPGHLHHEALIILIIENGKIPKNSIDETMLERIARTSYKIALLPLAGR